MAVVIIGGTGIVRSHLLKQFAAEEDDDSAPFEATMRGDGPSLAALELRLTLDRSRATGCGPRPATWPR